MKNYAHTPTSYLSLHKKQCAMALGLVVIIVAAPLIAWAIRSQAPSYAPVKACDLLTVTRAEKLLGERVNNVEADKPVVIGDVATSQCGYSDLNPDNMKVAALVVKSAVNDKGVDALHKAFKSQKSQADNTAISDVGDSAYFSTKLGLLYVLDGKKVLVISYGAGDNQQANDSAKLVTIAHMLLSEPAKN